MNHRFSPIGLIALVTTLPALAQTGPVIRVGENILVSRALEDRPLTEPHLVAHPTDRARLLGAAIVSSATAPWSTDQYCAAFLSQDGGRSWTRHDFPVLFCHDPWVALTFQGAAVFTALGRHLSLPDSAMRLLVFRSPDGGRSWHATPQSLGRAHDHQTVAADPKGGVFLLSGQGWRDAGNDPVVGVRGSVAARAERLRRVAPFHSQQSQHQRRRFGDPRGRQLRVVVYRVPARRRRVRERRDPGAAAPVGPGLVRSGADILDPVLRYRVLRWLEFPGGRHVERARKGPALSRVPGS